MLANLCTSEKKKVGVPREILSLEYRKKKYSHSDIEIILEYRKILEKNTRKQKILEYIKKYSNTGKKILE